MRNAVFSVDLTAFSQEPILVDYAVTDRTATAPGDYTADTGTVTIPPGQAGRGVTVAVLGDDVFEHAETFIVTLSNLRGAPDLSLADAQGVGTIPNDDAIDFSIDDVDVPEGDVGAMTTARFTVTVAGSRQPAVDIDFFTTDGGAGATAPADYTARNGTLTIPAGQQTGFIDISVNGDDIHESNETFLASLLLPADPLISVTDDTGVGTILDDDPVELSIGDVSVQEGDSGQTSVFFTITPSRSSEERIFVSAASSDGTATDPDD